ncbi:FG-GAP repeat protein [bacterium]|nr:FG-GAP repeat protein [bacterium]
MTVRIAAFVVVCCLLPFVNTHAQEPQFLGKIVSDTINSSFGRRVLPMGDQNGDGFADLLVYDNRGFFSLFLGGESVSNLVSFRATNQTIPFGNSFDANQDGYRDWAVHGGGRGIRVYFGGPIIDDSVDWWFWEDTLSGFTLFQDVTSDINNDGRRELVSNYYSPGKDRLLFFELSLPWDSLYDFSIGIPQTMTDHRQFADQFALGDFNGDGFQDIATNAKPKISDTPAAVCIFYGGPAFDTLVDLTIYRPGGYVVGSDNFGAEVLLCPGDLNADGWDDLVIGSSHAGDDSLTFVFFGGPSLDTIPDVTIAEYVGLMHSAGDVNNDGALDLISSLPLSWIGGLHVQLYYGGADIDSIPDWEIRGADLPGLNSHIGMDVTGIGDYNGDGIDDFAFSTIDNQTGTVWIYAGFDGSTDAGGGGGVVLPVDFQLYQNYPNPFNPTTTIAFQLPVKSHVEIDVFNVLGRRVTTIVSAEFPAGSHSVVWDGTDAAGDDVASGVYVYRLTAGEAVLSRKMVLAR